MKRFALAILVVASVAGLAFAVLNRPAAEGSLYPIITVNSTDDTDARNNKLTLREAMMLATGDLTLGDLTQGECGQVSGTQWWGWPVYECVVQIGSVAPGAKSADTIVFDTGVFPPGSPGTIALSTYLPELDTGGDTVDGSSAGVIVDGNEMWCFWLGSDGNTLKGLEIYNCGDADMGNLGGVYLQFARNNTIDRNVISGNAAGVCINGGEGNIVVGNYIGTDASGSAAVPNVNYGVMLIGCPNNVIGGTSAIDANIIAFNTGDGVWLRWGDGNTIRGNSIHSNGGKGIENVDGGNEELEPPTVQTAGSLFGTACPNCTVDIYSDDEDEGRVYEGSTTADGDGNWSFSGTPEGPNITATATDSDGNTSEFSAPVAVPEPTPTPTPSPSPSPTPTATPSPTPSPTPEATRTVHWGPGWHNATWSGASTPEEAFACAAGNYAAAYRLVSGGWERYFPDRSEISNMGPLNAYDAFLILVTGDVTCEMAVADPAATERTLDWGVGWQNEGWTGADGMPPEDVFDCAEGSYAAAYRLVGGGWERYFPDRPEISNMGPLGEYDAFLILVTEPVSCTMAVAP